MQINTLYAEFVKTDKNQIAEDFLDKLGFVKILKDETIKQRARHIDINLSGTLYLKQLEVNGG